MADLRAEGLDVAGQAADVRDRDSVRALVAAVVETYGPVNVLVNNAGRSGGGVTADLSDDLWYDVIDTNLNSVFLVTREVIKNGGLADAAYGRIINIASTAGKQGVLLGAPTAPPSTVSSASPRPSAGSSPARRHRQRGLPRLRGDADGAAGCARATRPPGTPPRRDDADAVRGEDPARPLLHAPGGGALVAYLASEPAASITAQALNVCGGLGSY